MTDKLRKYVEHSYVFIGWVFLKLGNGLPSGGVRRFSVCLSAGRTGVAFAELAGGQLPPVYLKKYGSSA